MIKVIDGKRYSTETAALVYEYWNLLGPTDFRFRTKDLYRTDKGVWFIHHQGGPMTDMAVNVGSGSRGGSECIEVVSDDDAYGFLAAHSEETDAMAAIDRYFADRVTEA